MARKAGSAKASSWEKVSAKKATDTLAHRDVYEDQQLDRSAIGGRKSRTSRTVVAVIFAALVFVAIWALWSIGSLAVAAVSGAVGDITDSGPAYYEQTQVSATRYCYQPIDQNGKPLEDLPCYKTEQEAKDNPPQWYVDYQAEQKAEGKGDDQPDGLVGYLTAFSLWKLLASAIGGLVAFAILNTLLMRNLDAQNLLHDTSDINQYKDDQHIALPEEVQRKFDWFPDVGAHSDVQVSSMISHVMLSNKGLKKIDVSRRAEADIVDSDGDLEYLKGEVLRDDDDRALTTSQPLIDEKFGEALFEASGLPKDKAIRKRYDTPAVPYNPKGEDRDKLGQYKTVADLINADWTFPEYEVQRPAGAYLVDTTPVNTMVLAITRAGKGQTYIEPMIDMWLREKRPSNIVINDPKGELLVKNYVRATMRGFQVVQFNLINAMKTDIYNPLGMAADAAREGDATKCALYVENIADVFFPLDGGEDPVWPTAANNAFKRAAYGLIDFYLEEERELRAYAARTNMPTKVLETQLDEKWGKVTLYNCYQLFVQLTSKKSKNPLKALEERAKRGEFGSIDGTDFREDDYIAEREEAQRRAVLWEDKPEADLLTLYFNATEQLPRNTMRTLIVNANNALRAMAGAEKMLASVYGIAITAMSFFTDPTISTLTSGTPSQNTDLGGLSFPRRMGVRFGVNFLKRDHLIGAQVKWDAYGDAAFQNPLGADFEHDDIVSREGWARYYFKGKFPESVAHLRLRLINAQTGMLIRTFYFRFTKDHQTSLNGRHYVTDPVTGQKIVKNGVLVELKPVEQPDGSVRYEPGNTTYPQMRLTNLSMARPTKEMGEARAITQTMVRYSEQPKVVFLVTPPHLMKYAKLILILIKQLVDLNFDKSYMTKADQKPLYKTRFMLDELGNLQSDGHGISGFETMLSIGLGQEQQFTLILQTLQQLRDVYGESVDKIVQGNCLPLDARIATPHGWTTMEKIQPGDQLMTPFGTVTTVTDKYPVKVRPVYRLTLRDGSSVEACPDHLWPVERWKSSIKYLGGTDENGRRLYVGGADGKTAERVTEIISTEELKERIDKGRQVDLIPIDPVAYPEADVPVDPYVLGAILGDAHIQPNGVVKFACNDAEIVEEIRRRGYTVVDDLAHGERVAGINYRINGVNKSMRELHVAGKRAWEKSIPEVYLRGSVQQRIDLLRGLMDTDGTISKTGEMEFTSCSPELAENVQEVVRSLGGRVAINVKTNITYTSPNQPTPKAARDAYRVQNIRLPEINPFLLRRKAERWHDRTRSFNRVVSVEYVREDLVQCIRVADERHLYLTDDFIPTHNTSNIVFLKSTDDSMIETLEKMSGTRHVSYVDSKTITKDTEKVIKAVNTEGKVSYTMSTKEEPVIKYNDMAFISERNSIVFRAGDAPVWNRNEMILPMSWRMFQDTIEHPGNDYSLQTIPTLSSALDFDVRMNQPDFEKMLAKRMKQAEHAIDCKSVYQEVHGYSDADVARLDPDLFSEEVMELVDEAMREKVAAEQGLGDADEVDLEQVNSAMSYQDGWEANLLVEQEVAQREAKQSWMEEMIYADKQVSRSMLVNPDGSAKQNTLDPELIVTYKAIRVELERDPRFSVGADGALRSADGTTVYISKLDESDSMQRIHEASEDPASRVYAEEDLQQLLTFQVHGAFYQFLASLDSWQDIARGEFDRVMAQVMSEK